jgi:hypothetical protein
MFSLALAAQGDLAAIQQKLNSQFKLTTLTPDGSDIAEPGDVVVLQKDGLKMSALASPLMESCTYKDGKIGGGSAKRAWGGLGVALLQVTAVGLDTTGTATIPDSIPGHNAAAGEKFWVVAATAQRDGINFKLYSDADGNGTRYHANLKVLFPNKKQVPSTDAAMQMVAEVLTVVGAEDQGEQPAPAQSGVAPSDSVQGKYSDVPPSDSVQGRYMDRGNRTDYVELGSDGVFTLVQSGRTYGGKYAVEGDTVTAEGPQIKGLVKLHIEGGFLNYQNGTIYEKQAEAALGWGSVPAPSSAAPPQRQYDDIAPPPPPPAPAPTASIGELKAQVLADFGEPQKKAVNGPTEIYFYSDLKMKIVFTNGEVSNIE